MTIAPAFADQLAPAFADRSGLAFHVYNDGEYAARGVDGRNGSEVAVKDGCKTCCYLAYTHSSVLGCPLLLAFGLSLRDSERFAHDLSTCLFEYLERAVFETDGRRLVMVEYTHTRDDVEFEVILDATTPYTRPAEVGAPQLTPGGCS